MSPQQSTPVPTLPPASTPTPEPTAQPTPTEAPVQFSIKARWEKQKAKPALNGPALKSSKVGKTVQVDIYLVVDSAPAAAPVTFYVEVRLKGKKIASANDDETLDESDPVGWYPDVFAYKPKKTGKYTIYTRVEIGDKIVTTTSGALAVKK